MEEGVLVRNCLPSNTYIPHIMHKNTHTHTYVDPIAIEWNKMKDHIIRMSSKPFIKWCPTCQEMKQEIESASHYLVVEGTMILHSRYVITMRGREREEDIRQGMQLSYQFIHCNDDCVHILILSVIMVYVMKIIMV